jgi:hypothetical protein
MGGVDHVDACRPAQRYLASSALAASISGFVAVAHGQQHVLGEIQVTALFAVVFEDRRFDDRIHRTAFFAEAAINALGQVDVVARGAIASHRHASADSMVMAMAGHTASHSLQAMQRSSPLS